MSLARDPTSILAIGAISLLMTSVDQYLFVAYGLPPLYLQIVAMAALSLHLAMRALSAKSMGRLAGGQAAAFTVLYFYIFWTAVSYLYALPLDTTTEILIGRIKAAAFIVLTSLVLIRIEMRHAFAWVSVGVLGLATLLNVYDFVSPTFSEVPGRSAGFYLNPNVSGSALTTLPMITAIRVPLLGNFILLAAAGFGLLLTFSRSGWIIFLFGGLGLAMLGKLGGGRARFIFLGIVALISALLFYAYTSGELYLFMSRSSLGEFLDPNTLARLGSRGAALDDYSSIERSGVIVKGWEAFLEAPLLGHGVGYTYIWGDRTSTHNMVLLMGAELGLPGIAAYLGLFAVLIARARGVYRLLAVVLLADGMFTHNQLDFISQVIPIAFVIASLGDHSSRRAPILGGPSKIATRRQVQRR